jgi:DNA topoisomerase-1
VVTDKLIEHFADIVDVNFTARMEDELDEIAEGNARRTKVLKDFWVPFKEDLDRAEEKFERYVEEIDEDCPRCIEEGRTPPGRLQIRLGRYGRFIGCTRFAEEDGGCKYIRNLNGEERPEPEMLDEICPECGQHNLQRRVGRYGPFVGCSGYPECKYIKKEPAKELGIICPQCKEGQIVEKHTRFGMFYGCDRYPECDFSTSNPPVKDHPCPECGSLLVERPKSIRCWNCGAELDKDFHVTKSGDPEAEAAARAARSLARAARASAKKTAGKRTSAKKKTTAKKRAPAKKKRVAKVKPLPTPTPDDARVAEG